MPTRASAQYQLVQGQLRKSAQLTATRGLSPNYNRTLKYVFKSAATRGSALEPFQTFYQHRVTKGIPPAMVRLTLARKIATLTLVLCKKGECFDPEKVTKHHP